MTVIYYFSSFALAGEKLLRSLEFADHNTFHIRDGCRPERLPISGIVSSLNGAR